MAGAAVHVASMIGATPYYVAKGEDSESKTFTLPSMSIMSLISKFDRSPMLEILEKPTGKIDDLSKGGDMVLELASSGYATVQGLHYEISEEAKRILWQSTQIRTPASEKSVMSEIKKKADLFIGKERKKDGEELISSIISLGHQSCKNRVYRSFMEQKRPEIRAEIWEGPDGHRVRIYYSARERTMEEDPGRRKVRDSSIQGEMDGQEPALSRLYLELETTSHCRGRGGCCRG